MERFYGMAFTLSLFAVISIQKNVRDLAQYTAQYGNEYVESDDESSGLRSKLFKSGE